MSAVRSDPLRVADHLDDVGHSDVTEGQIEEVRGFLDGRVRTVSFDVDPRLLPLRLTKSTLASLGRCEGLAVAEARDSDQVSPITPEQFRGCALDRFVTYQLFRGAVLEPVEVLQGMLEAEGETDLLDFMDEVGLGEPEDERAKELTAHLGSLAVAAKNGWSGVPASWLPRTQSRVAGSFGEGSLICSGRIDIELGGPVTGRPGVVVEVKSGSPRPEHAAEMYHYALLAALRDGVAPSVMIRWYPGAPPSIAPVSAGVLETAAVRIADSMETWVQIVDCVAKESGEAESGRPPRTSPGAWCNWCPDADICPDSRASRREAGIAAGDISPGLTE